MSQVILVYGATGKQGGAVARRLAGFGFSVRALVRDPGKAEARALADQGFELAVGDYHDREALARSMAGVYGAYVVLPFFQEHHEREVAMGRAAVDAAKAAGVRHLVYSSGARANERTGVPHLDSKGEVERHLRSSGVPHTVLRPVAFNYSLLGYRPSVEQGVLPDPREGSSVVYQVDEDDHARYAGLALLDPAGWLGRGFETVSDALSVAELAAAFSRVAGRPVAHRRITWGEEAESAGEEVVRLGRWVEGDGPRLDVAARRASHPWLTTTEDYLRRAWPADGRAAEPATQPVRSAAERE